MPPPEARGARGAAWLERAVQQGLDVASRYPLPIIALVALLTLLAAWQATRVGVRANLDELLPQDSEITRLMEAHGQTRAQRDWLVLLLEGEDTYRPASLAALYAAMERIEARPEVTTTVDPFRFLSFTARGGPLRVERIAPEGRAPADVAAAQEFRRRLMADPLARGLVVSEDGASLGVLFNVPLSSDYRELLAAVREAVRPLRELGLEVSLAGMQTIDAATRDHLTADLPLLLVVSVLVIMATYYLSFRSVAAMILPVLVVGIATVWTVGSMSTLGLDFTIVSVTTPPFVMTLGSAYSVHVLTAYLLPDTPARDGTPPSAATVGRRLAAPVTAVTGVAATVILAAVTTAAGFGGLATASVAAVREFGVITGLGIAYCAILALVFLPACLQVLRVRPPAARAAAAGRRPLLLAALAAWVLRHRRVIVIVVPAAFLLLGFATLRLRYETDFTRFFRGADSVMDSNLHVQRRLGGFVDFNVTMTGPRDSSGAVPAGFFLDPQRLQAVERFEREVRALPGVSWSYSFVSELQRMNQALTGSHAVPERRAAVLLLARLMAARQTAGLAQGPSPLDLDGSQLHMNARVFDAEHGTFFLEGRFREFLEHVERLARELLPADVTFHIWSGSVAALRLTEVLARDHVISIVVSVALVFLIAALGFRSATLGALALLPMALGIVVILASLALTGTALDTLTMMFTSVAVGAGVDYAVHVIVGVTRRLRSARNGGPEAAIRATMTSSGRAIVINTASLAAGLLVLALSSFTPVARLGALLAVTIVAAAIGSLVVLPAFLRYHAARV